MQPNPMPRREPAVAPAVPAFYGLYAALPGIILSRGPRAAAVVCRTKADEIAAAVAENARPLAFDAPDVTDRDLDELEVWLRRRADELEGGLH